MRRDDSRAGGRTPSPGVDDRAVSEVLSYVLIFTLIVASIGIVTVGGLGSLQDARENEHASNAERAFDVLHDNLAAVHSEEAPSRSTEIQLGDAQLYLEDNVTMTVETGPKTVEKEFRPIVFRVADDRRVVYEAGATLVDQGDGAGVVVNEPPFLVSSSRIHVPIVQTYAPAVTSVGSGTVLVRGQSSNRSIRVAETAGSSIDYIQIESPRFEVWEQYFEQQDYCVRVRQPAANTARCVIDGSYDSPSQLYVTVQTIDVTLIK